MGDRKRFAEFAKVIRAHLPLDLRIADVAGGKGQLQAALRQLGYRDVTSWDKRKKCARGREGYRWGWFSWNTQERYDAVVALHPDEGTDHALLYALRVGVPAIICPCCIRPSATAFWNRHKYSAWLAHLEKLAAEREGRIDWLKLPIAGRNDVMVLTPSRTVAP